MRALLWLVLGIGVLWGGYWVVGSRAVESGVQRWFDAQEAQGVTATQEGIGVAGFPSRFDLTVTRPHFIDPRSGWGWTAPFAQVLAMTWKPWHVIAVLPKDQVIEGPDQTIAMTTSRMAGSLRLAPSSDLTLKEVIVEGHDIIAKSDIGWQVGIASVVMALAEDPTQAFAQRLGLEITGLVPDPQLAAQVPDLGDLVQLVHVDATVLLTAPLDRNVAEVPPGLVGILLNDANLEWGSFKLTASGRVDRGADGLATGKIDFRIKNWRQIPTLLVATGLVLPDMGATITRGIEVLARQGADPDVLDLPLTFADGRMTLGPLPLGPAPMLN